jgi:hypothetical protein
MTLTHCSFETLPRRVFLDSSTLQTIRDYGGYVWENEALSPHDRIFRVPNGIENLEALRKIFFINQRAGFEFALSENSLIEAAAKDDYGHLQWAYDVLDHWLVCMSEGGGPSAASLSKAQRVNTKAFGYLGAGDRALIGDAVAFRCDAFLTMERRLPKNAPHIQRELGLHVLTPIQHWDLLRPHAHLWA